MLASIELYESFWAGASKAEILVGQIDRLILKAQI